MASSPLAVRSCPGGAPASTLTVSFVNSSFRMASFFPSLHSAAYFFPISNVVGMFPLFSRKDDPTSPPRPRQPLIPALGSSSALLVARRTPPQAPTRGAVPRRMAAHPLAQHGPL